MSRSPNVSDVVVGKIVAAIGRMAPPITWNRVVAVTIDATGATYTRQALSKHPSVLAAYRKQKSSTPAGNEGSQRPRSAREASRERSRAEVQALRAALWAYEEKFILIFANAYALNINEERLLMPLAPCDPSPNGRKRRSASTGKSSF